MSEAADSVKLTITFGGLCLFATEDSPGGGPPRVHVLMPDASHGHGRSGGHEIPPHHACVVYDAKYEARPDVSADPAAKLRVRCHRVRGYAVQLRATPAATAQTTDAVGPLPNIVDLAVIAEMPGLRGGWLPRRLLGNDAPRELAARLTLTGGTWAALDRTEDGTHVTIAEWGVGPGGPSWHMAWGLRWTLPIAPGTHVDLAFTPIHGGAAAGDLRPITLRPSPGGVVALQVLNAMRNDLPPRDAREACPYHVGDPAEHFEAYYLLAPALEKRVPLLRHDVLVPHRYAQNNIEGGCKSDAHLNGRSSESVLTVASSVCTLTGGAMAPGG